MSFVAGAILNASQLNDLDVDSLVVDTDTLVVDKTNNRVGIGTTAPRAELDVSTATGSNPSVPTEIAITTSRDGTWIDGDVWGKLAFRSADTSGGASAGDIAASISASQASAYGYTTDLSFTTRGDSGLLTRLHIDYNGNVGIGTTSPADLLDVGDGSTLGSFRVHATGGAESFRVTGTVVRSTNIRDLTTATAANVVIAASNASMYRSTSSIKYKSPVEDLEDDYADRVLEMRPVWYRSITGNDPADYSYYGLIAEEVAAIDPRLVSFGPTANCICDEDPDDPGVTVHTPECLTEPEGVQYDRLVPHLISVAQRQATQIEQLLARVEALESA